MALYGVLRAALYLYFSFLCSMIVSAVLLFAWLKVGGSAVNLLGVGEGAVGWIAFLVVLAALVFPRLQTFNEPVSLMKWIPLCLAGTLLGVLSVLWIFSATFCVVCL